ncbi:MAG: response regulator [Crocinitomicaceae bacterium]
MKKPVRIVVADDHPMLLKGLADELAAFGYNVVASEENGSRALEQILKLKPDVAVLDIRMPILSGFEVIKKCKEEGSSTKIIILTSFKDKGIVFKAKQLGVNGYLLKDEPFKEIQKCIQSVTNGQAWFSSTFHEVLNNEVSVELAKLNFLSPSEKSILKMIADGKNSKEIGTDLNISHRTVEKHRSNIISKLEIDTSVSALTEWIRANKDLFTF